MIRLYLDEEKTQYVNLCLNQTEFEWFCILFHKLVEKYTLDETISELERWMKKKEMNNEDLVDDIIDLAVPFIGIPSLLKICQAIKKKNSEQEYIAGVLLDCFSEFRKEASY